VTPGRESGTEAFGLKTAGKEKKIILCICDDEHSPEFEEI
jgi:hypothetical protein